MSKAMFVIATRIKRTLQVSILTEDLSSCFVVVPNDLTESSSLAMF